MKITELSIGDWVRDVRAITPRRIAGITPKGNVQMRTYDGTLKSVDIAYIGGLQLTLDILRKNGWKQGAWDGMNPNVITQTFRINDNQHLTYRLGEAVLRLTVFDPNRGTRTEWHAYVKGSYVNRFQLALRALGFDSLADNFIV